jgi:hypothetical protein
LEKLASLEVHTTDGSITYFKDDEAKQVYKTISEAGIRGAEWTIPAKLEFGFEVVFVLNNIVKFLYSENTKL